MSLTADLDEVVEDSALLAPLQKLRRDIKQGLLLTEQEARFLVDAYYASQDYRIQAKNQVRAAEKDGKPHEVITWHFQQMRLHENEIRRVLDAFTDNHPSGMGVWAKNIIGIGPVLSAGLIAHIDIAQAPTVGHIWAFAGLDPTTEWKSKEKRPWNAKLKTLCWKIGESFVKQSGNPGSQYGKLYRQRKDQEEERNLAGAFADQAARMLETKNFRDDTYAKLYYEAGYLPPAHVHARAKRYAVKLFLAHFWEEWYRRHNGKEPPLPYPIAHLGHAHIIQNEENSHLGRENHTT
jgi:hypothetical protein